ncbi:alpha/beta hydrolase [Microvirga lotononidis]|uniref:Esterase/lipase n=1 Tax=Microvirga lotononidis TaxID=864069 RepID=I4YXP6_9HYPH|nr:alpha/beta hydrolase [Microvirga lotononidis]EIM28738.1 esterase/lipase [Microvirga lotononidis]WQO25526.1 alpha/beta hydrolase [Microvirga lotononidis]
MIDPAVFDPSAISDEIRAQNAEIVAKLAALPDPMSVPPALVRERRRQGLGPFPLMPLSSKARTIAIDGPAGPIPLRIIAPENPRGVYLHIHGGGWTWGTADEQDPWLDRLADRCGLAVVSVEYRLAPENPYPAPLDDCEAAALWVIREMESRFGTSRLFIGGESAGAHLSAVTILRLRDKHGLKPFRGANLFAGCYDLRLTPSVRHWGPERLILNTNDVRVFAENFVGHVGDRTDPDISPLHADLNGLPPALFSVGTKDMLLDDTLFMASRWAAAGNTTELAVWPGGCHVFIRFDSVLSEQALARIDGFIEGL